MLTQTKFPYMFFLNLSLKMRVAKAVVFPDGLRLDDREKEVA